MKKLKISKSKNSVRWLIMISLVLLLSSTSVFSVNAQIPENNWKPPENISNTGATVNPHLIRSSSGRIHAFWEDQYAQILYKYFENETWSDNVTLNLPFYQMDYKLVTDQTGWVLSFWIDPGSNHLYYTGVQETGIAQESRWFSPVMLASGVTAFDVSIDDGNQINLVYLRALDTNELPSGIYYQKTQGSFQSWGTANILYKSKYFRNQLPPAETTASQTSTSANWSHVDIETGSADRFFISWENPALKRLFYSFSETNGNSWTEPIEISGPSTENTYLTPENLLTANLSQHSMQIWQLSEPGGNCSLQYRVSLDQQNSWSPQQSLANLINECPEDIAWFSSDQEDTIFVFSGAKKFTILAWNGERWSLAQSQTGLNQFTNPVTFRSLDFRQFATTINFPLIHTIALDDSSGDIWYSQKSFGNLESWFNPINEWSTISNLTITEKTIKNLESFTGMNGNPSFIWSIEDTKDDGRLFSKLQIAEMRSDGSVPGYISVRNNLSGKITNLSIHANSIKQRLALIWQGGIYGQLVTSWGDLNELNNPVGWSETETDTTFPAVHSPIIVNDAQSDLFAVFSTQFAEDRGIYTRISTDAGETWMDSALLYSALNTGDCPVIQNPQLILNEERYHLLYTCFTDSGGVGPLSLNSVTSSDQGQTWSAPEMISEGEILWSSLSSANDGTLHRLWMIYNGESAIYHNYSTDNGNTWLSRTNFSLVEGRYPNINLSIDHTGNLHVLNVIPQENNLTAIEYHFWDGSSWSNRENLELFTYQTQNNLLLTSTIDRDQNLTMGIILSSSSIEQDTNQLITARYSLGIDPPAQTTQIETSSTQDSIITENNDEGESQPLIQTDPTPTAVLNTSPAQSTNAWIGTVFGSLAAFGLTILAFIFIKRKK